MRKQNTIKGEAVFEGVGLHSGDKVKIILKPAPEDTGIVFVYNDTRNKEFIPFLPDFVIDTKNNISLSNGRVVIKTVEHLTSALSSLKIDNCIIEMNGKEIPILDGSARDFVTKINEVGIIPQSADKPEFIVISPVWVRLEDKFIVVLPYNGLKINYTISFPNSPIGMQNINFDFSTDNYIRHIANARTFGFIEDIDEYTRQGLILGANFENVHVFSKKENKCINQSRYDDEPVRHKVLDLLGALALLPFEVKGYIISYRGGHNIDVMFIKKIMELYNSNYPEKAARRKEIQPSFYGTYSFLEDNVQ
ncbi:MAG: UDP-3-O-acyl-N-acetylglucosamine deacetylase [Brevinematia bacterium]